MVQQIVILSITKYLVCLSNLSDLAVLVCIEKFRDFNLTIFELFD